jgi:prepilin-type N-terminal cleavage/methylation domain-containing protein
VTVTHTPSHPVSVLRHAWQAGRRVARCFTLLELLVAMGIIALLATIAVFSVRNLSRDAKLSSGTNTVIAVLGEARALAMKNNALVLVVFRPNWDPQNPARRQFTEAVIAQWTGQSLRFSNNPTNPDFYSLSDRFVPIQGKLPRPLPIGIKVAGPHYEINQDTFWLTQPELRQVCREWIRYSQLVGVMFGPTGEMLTRNPNASGGDHKTFVDFNNNGLQDINGAGWTSCPSNTLPFWFMDDSRDECNVNLLPFLCVYDDDQAREFGNPANWGAQAAYEADLVGPIAGNNIAYISRLANRIHFNRYTGVAMTTRGPGG